MKKSVTCVAPINIAVVKYWGKLDEEFNIPLNSSLSLTLDVENLCTQTTLTLDASLSKDELWLNGFQQDISKNKRIQRCLKEARKLATKNVDGKKLSEFFCKIVSTNNFPTAAGLASSASGFACLAKCLGEVFKLEDNLSSLARLGSGSACRSMDGGFVKWRKGVSANGIDSVAEQIVSENHWSDLRCLILVVSNKQKSVPSTEGMRRSVETSELLQFRIKNIVDARLEEMEDSIVRKDFENFAKLTMKESNQLHAICQDTYPPITPPYMNKTSHKIIKFVTQYNQSEIKVAYTFDAGANAVLFTLERNMKELLATLMKYFSIEKEVITSSMKLDCNIEESIVVNDILITERCLERVIVTKGGQGATVISNEF